MSGSKESTRTSRTVALILRHDPGRFGVTIDAHGWADVRSLVHALRAAGRETSLEELRAIVDSDPKGRYTIEGHRIRANQGHSYLVDLELVPSTPPDTLYHGCPVRVLDPIMRSGISRMERHHVHLSPDAATARVVGGRRGRYVVLAVAADEMVAAGHLLYRSTNGVWLTDHVPPAFVVVEEWPTG